MANPQRENGHVRIANEIMEAMAKSSCFGGAMGQVNTAILRKTYGYNKKKDAISISQLIELTQLSRRSVIYALQQLEAKKIILVERKRNAKKNETNVIAFNKNYDEWVVQNSAKQVEKNRDQARISSAKLRKERKGSAKLSKLVVQNSVKNEPSFAPTINTNTKNNTKDTKQHFESLWDKYPKKLGKKEALKHYLGSVKTEQDKTDIETALEKYLAYAAGKETRYIQHGRTWFNNWQDWIEYEAKKVKVKKPVYIPTKTKEELQWEANYDKDRENKRRASSGLQPLKDILF